MIRLVSLLVGSHFVPPAKTLLEHLPSGAALSLEPDPSNPYDEHAIRVLVRPGMFPESQWEVLREKLPASGHDWDELLATAEPLILGHVASSEGKPLLKAKGFDPSLVGNQEFERAMVPGYTTKFGVGADGNALVILESEA